VAQGLLHLLKSRLRELASMLPCTQVLLPSSVLDSFSYEDLLQVCLSTMIRGVGGWEKGSVGHYCWRQFVTTALTCGWLSRVQFRED